MVSAAATVNTHVIFYLIHKCIWYMYITCTVHVVTTCVHVYFLAQNLIITYPYLFIHVARYCCLYCTTSKESMKLPIAEREPANPRTLQSILESYKEYEADGSRKARAKDVSHSIIAQPMIDIPIDHVSYNDTCKNCGTAFKPNPCIRAFYKIPQNSLPAKYMLLITIIPQSDAFSSHSSAFFIIPHTNTLYHIFLPCFLNITSAITHGRCGTLWNEPVFF